MKNCSFPPLFAASLGAARPRSAQAIPAATSPSSISKRSPAMHRLQDRCRRRSAARSRRSRPAKQRSPLRLRPREVDPGGTRCAARARSRMRRCRLAIKACQTKRQQARAGASAPAAADPAQPGLYLAADPAPSSGPIYQQVMQKRGANLMVEVGTTLATSSALDVTNDVLAALNAALPTVQTTAPARSAAQSR